MKLRIQLAGSAAVLALASAFAGTPAWAQSAQGGGLPSGTPAASTETITVTGSLLKTNNATAESPVTVVTAAQIQRSSSQTVEEVLQKLPSIGTSGLYGTTNNGGQGASCTDIRNLGINRTLVLVNGRRFVHSGIFGVDCVDLNNIPLGLVDRIEILKDGASSIYGADAVAGVVNIILKKNFSGTQVTANGSIAGSGDSRSGEINVTTGGNFDKGNVVINLGYTNTDPLAQRDRSWAVPVVGNNSRTGVGQLASGIPPNGRAFLDSNSTLSPNNPNYNALAGNGEFLLGNGKYRPFSNATDRYDYGQLQDLVGSLEKESFTSLAHYDFTPGITGFLETYFTHKESTTQLAGQPVTGGLNAGLPDAFIVPAGNPYNPFGTNVDLYRRTNDFGGRENIADTTTFQITTGFDGQLGYGWDYDTFFTYGRSDNNIKSTGEVNFANLENSVGFQHIDDPNAADPSTNGVYNPAVCQAPCVLSNPFGPNSFSKAAVNYISFTETANATFSLRQFGGTVSNSDVFDLPYGPLGLVFGAEHRREAGSYTPDNLVQSGVTLENSQNPTKGQFDVTEVFGETKISLLKDLPGVKDLSVDLSGRYFSYNTFGDGETWKAGFNYTPITGLRFRGNIGTAFRQPGINELFGGQSLSFNAGQDPCANVANYGSKAGTVQANCAAQGINTGTFTQTGNAQVQTITGGNPNLLPETARTETIGAIISPPFAKPLAITVDYWRTKIENTVSSVGTQDILDGCYTSANFASPFCSLINPRAAQQQLSTVEGTLQNLGVTKTDGLDIGLNYVAQLPNGLGSLTFQNDMQLLFKYASQNLPDGPFIGYAGKLIIGADGPGYPRQRDNASITWDNGPYEFGYRMRYLSGMGFYPDSTYNPKTQLSTAVPEIFYHDIVATYVHNNLTVTVGMDNVLDQKPPFAYDTATNTDPTVYDVFGRVIYLHTTFKF